MGATHKEILRKQSLQNDDDGMFSGKYHIL